MTYVPTTTAKWFGIDTANGRDRSYIGNKVYVPGSTDRLVDDVSHPQAFEEGLSLEAIKEVDHEMGTTDLDTLCQECWDPDCQGCND